MITQPIALTASVLIVLALAGARSAAGRRANHTRIPPQAGRALARTTPGGDRRHRRGPPGGLPVPPAADKNTGAAILICPGGGFTTRCMDFEGVLVARWLNAHGIAGFVLRYRIRPMYGMKESLRDAQRGAQFIRAHADEFHIAPDRLGIVGFSAGGELAATAATRPLAARPDAATTRSTGSRAGPIS